VLALVKRTFALPNNRPALCTLVHWLVIGSSFGNKAAALGGGHSYATTITLVTIPPEGGIYYSQVYLVWSSEDQRTLAVALIASLPSALVRGVTVPIRGKNIQRDKTSGGKNVWEDKTSGDRTTGGTKCLWGQNVHGEKENVRQGKKSL
jgi:hypothetical protein